MTILESMILGIVEGLTEYLPVSSTGHLIITQYLLGLEDSDALKAFEICIQGGAIIAVLGLYFERVKHMLHGVLGIYRTYTSRLTKEGNYRMSIEEQAGIRMLINMIVGFIPAMIVGLLCSSYIKDYLFNAKIVTISWAVGGLVILIYVRMREKKGLGNHGKTLEQLTWKGALSVGLLQCLAMCPGTSRSLMTMLGGLFAGLSISAAVEFSFLLGLITLGAATCYDAFKYGADMVASIGWGAITVGTITAWASALIAVKWMVGYLNRHSLSLFGWYRIAAAIIMFVLIRNGLNF